MFDWRRLTSSKQSPIDSCRWKRSLENNKNENSPKNGNDRSLFVGVERIFIGNYHRTFGFTDSIPVEMFLKTKKEREGLMRKNEFPFNQRSTEIAADRKMVSRRFLIGLRKTRSTRISSMVFHRAKRIRLPISFERVTDAFSLEKCSTNFP